MLGFPKQLRGVAELRLREKKKETLTRAEGSGHDFRSMDVSEIAPPFDFVDFLIRIS